MFSFKKSRSHLVAFVLTMLIHMLAFVLLSINYTGESSSSLSEEELEAIELQLNDAFSESIPNNQQGKDPLTNKKDNLSESLSEKKALLKTPTSSPVEKTDEETEPIKELTHDTLVPPPKKEVVLKTIDVDSTVVAKKDSVLASTIIKEAKTLTNADYMKAAHERFEFYKNNYKAIRNFKLIYPYALRTKQIIEETNKKLKELTDKEEKRKLVKNTERMLFKEYEKVVRNMSISQGKLLLKLIARETNKTGYEIIKDYEGTIPATFWYGVGRLFGTNLKTDYDKAKEDSLLEVIVKKYHSNDLY